MHWNVARALRACGPAMGCVLLLSLAACSGSTATAPPPAAASGEVLQSFEQSLDGVRLALTTASAPGGGVAGLRLEREAGPEPGVSVHVENARGLRSWALEAEYDPQLLDPQSADATRLLAAGSTAAATGTLEFSHLALPGRASVSQALIHAASQRGMSGSGQIALLRFARRPFSARAASAAPTGGASQTPLSLSNATRELRWGYYSQGDYDQNRETNAADLRSIADNFRRSGSFPVDSIEAVIDSDGNKEINAADLKGIAQNFQRRVGGYRVYSSLNLADMPASDAASTIEPVAEVLFSAASGDPRTQRLRFGYTFSALIDGAYVWVRPFDGDHEGVVSQHVQYNAPNQAPQAALTASPVLGEAPLAVTLDAGGSSDPDGIIAKYEFDYDGDGAAYDWVDNGATSSISMVYLAAGSYTPRVRVTDDSGAQASAGLAQPIVVEAPADPLPPDASFTVTPSAGAPPLNVAFDGSASSDPDGTITLWEWDWESDGSYDEANTVATTSHSYGVLGLYTATLRVTDDDGLTDIGTRSINVTNGGVPPTARLSNDAALGEAPMTVSFDASASTDADGSIVRYEWDWDYAAPDFTVDEDSGAAPTVSHQFTTGSMDPTVAAVRVTDNDGLTHIAANSMSIYPNGDYNPFALLTATPRYGAVPVSMTFDASASWDIDGSIVKYEWDWEGDGTYDHDSGPNPVAAHLYAAAGVFDAKVRATDNDGFTGEKIMLVMPTANSSFPPDDSIFALPSQSFAGAGETVIIEVHTKNTLSPLQYMTGCGITLESGNPFVPGTMDAGQIDFIPDFGSVRPTDGVWTLTSPIGFIWFSDSLIVGTEIGGGRTRYDFNVTPLGGTAQPGATGALFNFGVAANSDMSFSFQRISGVSRTYYSDGVSDYFWSSDDNAGLPGISVL